MARWGQPTPEPGELRRGPSNAGYCPRPVGGIHSEPWTGKILILQINKMKGQLAYSTTVSAPEGNRLLLIIIAEIFLPFITTDGFQSKFKIILGIKDKCRNVSDTDYSKRLPSEAQYANCFNLRILLTERI